MNRWHCLFLWVVFSGCASHQREATAQTVYVTKTGAKYHRELCQYLKLSKIPMKLAEAKKHYTACSVCSPSTGEEEPASSEAYLKDTLAVSIPAQDTEARSKQCSGITKSGSRCKRTTNDPSGKCGQHK